MAIVVTALPSASGIHPLVHNFAVDGVREHTCATASGLSRASNKADKR
jgi:hypothetical protein